MPVGPSSDLSACERSLLLAPAGKVKSPEGERTTVVVDFCVVAKLQRVVDGGSEIKALHL